MEHHLKRVLRLVQRTGDTMIVVDKEGDDAFVVMDLTRYEELLEAPQTTEPSSTFASSNQGERPEEFVKTPDIWDVMQEAEGEGATWDIDQLSETELAELEKQYEAFANRHVQEAIEETVQGAVEQEDRPEEPKNAHVSPDEDEYGEEQFYLEPVE